MYGNEVVGACCNLMRELRSDGVILVMRLTETACTALPHQAPSLFTPVLSHVVRYIHNHFLFKLGFPNF